MGKIIFRFFSFFVLLGCGYLFFWPVPITPQAWEAPENAGYVDAFVPNEALADLTRISLRGHDGAEDAALGPDGSLYLATHDGTILRYEPETSAMAPFVNTGGRPLGVEMAPGGGLYVADAYRGLLAVSAEGEVTLLTDTVEDGSPIRYANNLDIAEDGTIYFSDASTRFGALEWGGTLEASYLELMEHGASGRVLAYDPATGVTRLVADGFSFANGIALTADGTELLIAETGTYTVNKLDLTTEGAVPVPILENLPGFPDNLSRALDGSFWLGVVSPRSAAADALSDKPFMRAVVQRLPAALRPKAQRYGFLMRLDAEGNVLEVLQDPSGTYAMTTGAIDAEDGTLYVMSLTEPDLAILPVE